MQRRPVAGGARARVGGVLMARGLQGVMLRGLGARGHKAMVVETVRLAPHFVRVRIESSTLLDDTKAEPAAWLRFWFPDPDGSNAEFQRAYTISEADVRAGRFAVDIVLHDPAGTGVAVGAHRGARRHDRGDVADGLGALRGARRPAGRLSVDRRLGVKFPL